jgi:RimJ/RimL family protein N-acetyltransferase
MSKADPKSHAPESCIQGRSVKLRLMNEGDAPAIVRWRNHPAVAKWLIQWQLLTEEKHLEYFQSARKRGEVLLSFLDLQNNLIGTGAIYDFDHYRKVAGWGRLCMNPEGEQSLAAIEASYLALRYGFERLSLSRLHGSCSVGNRAAIRLLEFMGFRQEGLRPQHLAAPDGYRDVVEYGLLHDDFVQQMKKIEKLLYRVPGSQVPVLEGNLE